MAEHVETLVMRFEPDDKASKRVEQTAQRLAARVTKLKTEIKGLQDQAKGLNRALDQDDKAFEEAIRNTIKLEKARSDLTKTQKDLRRSIEGVSDAEIKAARKLAAERRLLQQQGSQARLFGDVESRTRAITGAVGFVGGAGGAQIERTANIGSEVLASVEAIGLLRQELPQMTENLINSVGGVKNFTVGLSAAAIATTGIALALSELDKRAEEARKAVQAEIEFERQRSDLRLESLTTEQIDEQAAALQDSIDVRQLEIDRVQADRDALFDSYNAFEQLGEATGTFNQGLDDYDKRLSELQTEQKAENTLLEEVISFRDSETVAINDQIASLKELDERRGVSHDRIETLIADLDLEREAQDRAQRFSEEQRQNRLDAIDLDLAYEQQLRDEIRLKEDRGTVDAQTAAAYINSSIDRQDQLENERELLETVVADGVKLREDEAAALERTNNELELFAKNADVAQKAYQSAAAQQAKLADDLADVEQKRLDLTEEYAQKSIEIEEDRNLKLIQEAEKFALDRTNDLADHYKDLADLDRDYYQERGELLEGLNEDLADIRDDALDSLKEYNKDSQRLAEDHQDRLLEIQQRANRDIANAAAHLDAAGLFQAQQRANDELKAEEDKYSKEKDRREEDFQDQLDQYKKERQERQKQYRQDLRDLDRQHREERRREIAAFNEKIRREDQQRALEQQHQQQQWALEDQRRATQFKRETNALGQHYSALLTLTVDKTYQIELAYQNWLDQMVAATTTTLPGTASSVGGGGGFGTGQSFAAGGIPPLNRDVMVGERGPEIVRFQQPARIYAHGQRPGMEGASIVINVDGSRAPLQVGYAVRRELDNLIKGR